MNATKQSPIADWEREFFGGMLASQSICGRLNFRLGEFAVTSSDYRKIAGFLRTGEISLERFVWVVSQKSKGKVRRGSYNMNDDTIAFSTKTDPPPYLPFSERVYPSHTIAKIKQYGLLVHEATHAIQDMKEWSMTVGKREMMAHVAQAVCLLGFGEALLDDQKMAAALPVARALRTNQPVAKEDLASLSTVLQKVYEDSWDKVRKGDGILTFQ